MMSRAPITLRSENVGIVEPTDGAAVARITVVAAQGDRTLRYTPRQDEDGYWHIHDAELDDYVTVRAPSPGYELAPDYTWSAARKHWTTEDQSLAHIYAATLNGA